MGTGDTLPFSHLFLNLSVVTPDTCTTPRNGPQNRQKRKNYIGVNIIKHVLTLSFNTIPELARVLSMLGNEQRLAILGSVSGDAKYAREIAEELGISRPLVNIYLKQLEKLGLVEATSRTSEEPPYLRRYYRAVPFELVVNTETIEKLRRE
ncbi:winged helix-turn-helix transcriptional regulator [Methanoculleus sp. FWC-SCC1]|uniref:Winged helix-turn-helix transcriptional regulator n=1 Tax=Methanoculleus frigidifontis TaxID=2584085 RepID=A0ABT8M735_9EURY|nr:winged helix-turn-helix transcriptional regulator [Methanoculleus sp. FWC-SCC1]